jgi:site-specific DNA-methyltransferase (adenine-specific)
LPVYNPQYEDGLTNHSRGNGEHKNTNNCYGKYKNDYKGRTYESVPRVDSTVPKGKKLPRSIIRIKKEHESKVFHPTQKSVELLRYLIRTYTNQGDLVLDNACGSGSTCVAAIREKRNFIGIELNEDYYKIACDRIAREKRQLTLF